MEEDTEYVKLPVEDRCVHKLWRARVHGYEELAKLFRSIDDEKSPEFNKYLDLIKKFAIDINAVAQEKGLEAVLAYVENSGVAGKTVGDVMSGVITKCIAAPKTKELAVQITLMYIEIEQADAVQEELLKGMEHKNPKIVAACVSAISQALREFGPKVVNVKPLIKKMPVLLEDKDKGVREEGKAMVVEIYKWIGDSLQSQLSSLKPVQVTELKAEFEKVKGEKVTPIRFLKSQQQKQAKLAAEAAAGDAEDPTVRDNSAEALGTAMKVVGEKQIIAFMPELDNIKKTKHAGESPPSPIRGKTRKTDEGCEEEEEERFEAAVNSKVNIHDLRRLDISSHITEALLNELGDQDCKVRNEALQKLANVLSDNKLITNNLGGLPPALAERLVDRNSKIAAAALAVSESLGTAMGAQCKTHVRTLFPGFLQGMGHSKAWIRTAAASCINAWGEQCGYKKFFHGEMIGNALKSENPTLGAELWAWLTDKLPTMPPKSVSKDELLICVPHLYSNMEDRNVEVRKNAQEAALPFMLHLGYETMVKEAEKLKPGSQANIVVALDKARANLPAKPLPKKEAATPVNDEEMDQKTVKSGGAKAAAPATKAVGKGKVPPKTTGRKKDEDSDISSLLQSNNLKNRRAIDEQKSKVLKWNFTSPKEEFVDLLKDQMTTANVNKTLMANMFHSDFKYHLKAIDSLSEDLPNNPSATVANLDLILKWMTLRFFDTNPYIILKGLEYLQTVFSMLIEQDYNMFETEASSFIPYLILKIGDPKDAVRNSVRALLKQIESVYPTTKIFAYVMDGLKSKNARQRTECLDQLGSLILNYGVSVCQPNANAALKEVARHILDRDNSVRNAALNCVVQAYYIEGDRVYKMIGQISDKDFSLLEERIKRAVKNRPPPRAPPAQISKQHQQQSQPQKMVRQGTIKKEMPEVEQEEEQESSPPPPVMRYQTLSPPPALQPVPVATKVMNVEEKADYMLDTTIANIADPDTSFVIQSIVQLESVMQSDKALTLTDKMDHIILASVVQLKLFTSINVIMPNEELSKCYSIVLMLLMTLYSNVDFTKRLSRDVLRGMMDVLISLLVNKHMEELDNGESYVQTVNTLVEQVIEKSDHTNVTCALINSLHGCVKNSPSPEFTELVTKCLWKVAKLLPSWESEADFDMILYDIHLFLKDYPTSLWKKKQSDTPIRTIKSILHCMTKMKGNRILLHLNRIDNIKDSELKPYLVKLIKDTTLPQSEFSSVSSSGSHVEDLTLVGQGKQQGLSLLYDFKQQHPEADVGPSLRKASQDYVDRELQSIEMERKRAAEAGGHPSSPTAASSLSSLDTLSTTELKQQ